MLQRSRKDPRVLHSQISQARIDKKDAAMHGLRTLLTREEPQRARSRSLSISSSRFSSSSKSCLMTTTRFYSQVKLEPASFLKTNTLEQWGIPKKKTKLSQMVSLQPRGEGWIKTMTSKNLTNLYTSSSLTLASQLLNSWCMSISARKSITRRNVYSFGCYYPTTKN